MLGLAVCGQSVPGSGGSWCLLSRKPSCDPRVVGDTAWLRGNVRAITFPLAALLVSDGDRVLRERVGNLLQCEPVPTLYSKEVLTAGQFGLL